MAILRVRPWRRKAIEPRLPRLVVRARRKFLKQFPDGFQDQAYLERERNFRWEAHEAWEELLSDETLLSRLAHGNFSAVASDALALAARTGLLTPAERLALRDATRTRAGARAFGVGLHEWLYGNGDDAARFDAWVALLGDLPRRQAKVLTWPVASLFGFIARPYVHLCLRPRVIRQAAFELGFDFKYQSVPAWSTYASLMELGREIKRETRDLGPRDMIDVLGFIRVVGSDE